MYRRAGDEAKWLATLDRAIAVPSPGLENAQLQVSVARHLLKQGRAEQALPYARGAAETRARWAVAALIRVNEALGRFAEAEELTIQNGGHYNDPADWLDFCVRTGRGDRARAQAQLEAAVRGISADAGRELMLDRLSYPLLTG